MEELGGHHHGHKEKVGGGDGGQVVWVAFPQPVQVEEGEHEATGAHARNARHLSGARHVEPPELLSERVQADPSELTDSELGKREAGPVSGGQPAVAQGPRESLGELVVLGEDLE